FYLLVVFRFLFLQAKGRGNKKQARSTHFSQRQTFQVINCFGAHSSDRMTHQRTRELSLGGELELEKRLADVVVAKQKARVVEADDFRSVVWKLSRPLVELYRTDGVVPFWFVGFGFSHFARSPQWKDLYADKSNAVIETEAIASLVVLVGVAVRKTTTPTRKKPRD